MNKVEKARYNKTYRQEHKAYYKEYSAKRYVENREEMQEQHKEYIRNLRHEVMALYGGKCACCGENSYEFLTFDHINGGGAAHKRQGLVAGKRLVWLRDTRPTDIQVLCYNCNSAKGVYGECPHRLKRLVDE